jgi:tetratricopeptide (TPR) repeat protein
MPRAVILTAHYIDYQAVRAHLSNCREETHPQGTVYELGQFFVGEQIWEVAIAEIDNSNASAASETERAIEHFQPDVIILLGTATGIKDVQAGDVVVATKVYGYQSGRAEDEFLPRPEVQQPSYRIKERAKSELKKSDWLNRLPNTASNICPNVLLAPIASGDKEVVDQQATLLKFLRTNYGDAVAVETTAFGFLKAVHANHNVIALTVHGISRLIDTSAEDIVVNSRNIAAQNASAFIFEILAKFKIDNAETTERFKGVMTYGITQEELIATMGKQVELACSNNNDEYHTQINYARKLINQGEFHQAINYLNDLKEKLWYKPDNTLKYPLLANLGMAHLGLDETSEAAKYFLAALQYNPEDDRALAIAAMGYVFQKDYNNAESLINKSIQKNPANEMAYSLRIRIASESESIDSIIEKIPSAYRESLDVLVALGEAAERRNLDEKAEQYWQLALDRDNSSKLNTIKVVLGTTLAKNIILNFPLVSAGQLSEFDKQKLERSVNLFTEVLGGIFVNSNNLSRLEFGALINRSSVLRLLKKYNDAIRDIEIALGKEPNNPYCIKQRALLTYEQGNSESAYTYLQSIIDCPDFPDTPLLAADLLIACKRWDEAENIINSFIERDDIPNNLKLDAKHLQFDVFMLRDNTEKAKQILEDLIQEAPDSVITITKQVKFYKHIGSEEKIPPLIEQVKAEILSNKFHPYHIVVADQLYSWNYYRDAAEIYEQFVDKNINTKLTHKLLNSYYSAGNYKSALEICQQLLNKYGALESVSEIAAYIYDNIGDAENVIQICKAYLEKFPNDIIMQLRLAIANYDKNNNEELDTFLDSKPSIATLNLFACQQLAKLLKVGHKIDYFLEVIYEIRRRFYDNAQVRAFYVISYMEATKIQANTKEFTQVEDGCGVLIRYEFGCEEWFIVEDREDANLARNEINSQQPMYQALIAKSLGDEVVLAEDSFGRKTLKIIAITDKYFAAGKQSFSILDKQPEIKDFRSFRVPMDGDEISPVWMQQFMDMLQKIDKNFNSLKKAYQAGEIPFGLFAVGINRSPIELMQMLTFRNEPYIHAWSNFQNETFDNSLSLLQKGGLLVIDPISLITLYQLGVADEVVAVIGKFGIAQSTVNLFQRMLEDAQGFNKEGFLTFGIDNGQYVKQEFTPEKVANIKNYFQNMIDWIQNNCLILPCRRALDIDIDERNELNKCLGQAFTDTVLIAEEPGRLLYSDDQWLRWYANSRGIKGVWTQVVLNYCLLQKNTNEVLYQKATVCLILLGYDYTIIDAKTLLEGARLCNWQLQPSYTSVVKVLTNKYTVPKYAIKVAAEFIYQLYIEVIIPQTRDALIFHLLNAITDGYSQTQIINQLVQQLNRIIQRKAIVLPTFQDEISQLFQIWKSIQPIIT